MGRLGQSVLALAIALGAAGSAGALTGCDRTKDAKGEHADDIPVMSIDDLAVRIASGTCRAVDANGNQLRKDVGVIPGAVLLTDYETYAASELPADKGQPLVFYCANEQCGASHEAAAKAVSLGYKNVKVLPAGIMGWTSAGQRVEKL